MKNTRVKLKTVDYNRFLESHKFKTQDDFKHKANWVAFKVLVLVATIEFIALAGVYVFSIYVIGDSLVFKKYFINHINEIYVWFAIAAIFLSSLFSRQFIYKFYNYCSDSKVISKNKITKILEVSKPYPILSRIIKERIKSKGYLSEMDYRSLNIDIVHKHLKRSFSDSSLNDT